MIEEKTTVDRTQEANKFPTEDEKKSKVRNYTFHVYPDSITLNKNWRENIERWGHKAIISPIHDKDVFENGLPKKPHYHVCVFRENSTTLKSCIRSVGVDVDSSIKYIEVLRGTPLASYDYMSHKNAPNKAQYNADDITCLNGFSPFDYQKQTRTDKLNVTKEIYIYIENNEIEEFCDLMQLLIMEEKDDLIEYVANHAYFVDKIITSMRNKNLSLKKQRNEKNKFFSKKY